MTILISATIFLLIATAALPFAWNFDYSIERILSLTGLLILFIFIYSSNRTDNYRRYFVPFILCFTTIMCIYSLLLTIAILPDSLISYSSEQFVYKVFGHNNIGHIAAISFVLSLYFILAGHKKYLAGVLFFLPFLIFSYSRSSYIETIVGVLTILFLKRSSLFVSKKLKKLLAVICLFVPIVIFTTLFFVVGNAGISYEKYRTIFSYLPNFLQNEYKIIDGNRIEYWTVALQSFLQHPLIGLGTQGFEPAYLRLSYTGGIYTRSAFNVVLESMVDYGIVGLGFLVFLTRFIIKQLKSSTTHHYTHEKIPLYLALIMICVSFLFDTTYLNQALLVIVIFIVSSLIKTRDDIFASHNHIIIAAFILFFFSFQIFMSKQFVKRQANEVALVINPFNSGAMISSLQDGINKNRTLDYKLFTRAFILQRNNPHFIRWAGELYASVGDKTSALLYLKKYFAMTHYIPFDDFRFIYNVTKSVKGVDEAKIVAVEFFDRMLKNPRFRKYGLYSQEDYDLMKIFCTREKIECPQL